MDGGESRAVLIFTSEDRKTQPRLNFPTSSCTPELLQSLSPNKSQLNSSHYNHGCFRSHPPRSPPRATPRHRRQQSSHTNHNPRPFSRSTTATNHRRPSNSNTPLLPTSHAPNPPPNIRHALRLRILRLHRRPPQHLLRVAEERCRDPRIHRLRAGAQRSPKTETRRHRASAEPRLRGASRPDYLARGRLGR